MLGGIIFSVCAIWALLQPREFWKFSSKFRYKRMIEYSSMSSKRGWLGVAVSIGLLPIFLSAIVYLQAEIFSHCHAYMPALICDQTLLDAGFFHHPDLLTRAAKNAEMLGFHDLAIKLRAELN
ncbi:MAG: hypothetical protein K2W82_14975 [Candidatus Obscuribacterales bacterium]|nr:hypothetical protein [Candidatus Obscuribacterales bacterium]